MVVVVGKTHHMEEKFTPEAAQLKVGGPGLLETRSGFRITDRAEARCHAGLSHSPLTSDVDFILSAVLRCPSRSVAVLHRGHNSCRVLSQEKPPVPWDQVHIIALSID